VKSVPMIFSNRFNGFPRRAIADRKPLKTVIENSLSYEHPAEAVCE